MLQNAINSGDMTAANAMFDGMITSIPADMTGGMGVTAPQIQAPSINIDQTPNAPGNILPNSARGVDAPSGPATTGATTQAITQDMVAGQLTKAKPAYTAINNKLFSDFGGDPNNPEFKKWVDAKYSTSGTYNKYLRYYNAAIGIGQ